MILAEEHSLEPTIEDMRAREAALVERFISSVPRAYRHAAQVLEYQKVFLAHLKLTHTLIGKEALLEELQPKSDTLAIDRNLAEIREMRTFLIANEDPKFGGLNDIGPTLHKLEISGSSLYVEEGAKIRATLKAMRALREFFSRRAQEAPTLWKSAIQLFEDRLLEKHFDDVFDDAGNVRDSASAALARIRHDILSTQELLHARLTSILGRLSEGELVREEIITQREGRFVIPIMAEHKRRVPGFIHSVSQTGQTVFIEPSETLELNNDLRSLEFAEQREIDRILRGLADRVREVVPQLRTSLDCTAHLDAVHAKSVYAVRMDTGEAIIEEQVQKRPRTLSLKGARHPLLLEKSGREKTVPLTIELDEDRKGLILTGPNAGGKTVLLKTIGLLALMAHAGIPIPAEPEGIIPKLDGIFVEIGDSQSIAEDLSTFSSHVTSLANILDHVTRSSLVLLDEIGGGTAPEEGGALAESILEQVLRIGCFTIATTHYGRLAAFAESTAGASNGSMEFDRESLSPTFRFRMGMPGSSHAFDIAERFGMKHGLVERARELRGAEGARIEDLIASLDQLQREAREREATAQRELGAARLAKIEYERKREEAEAIRRTAKAKASEEAEEILKRANQFIEKAVREVREAVTAKPATNQEAEKEKLRTLRLTQERERKQIIAALAVPEVPPVPAEAGEVKLEANVRLKSNPSQIGKVVSIKGNDIEIEIGSLKMRVKRDQLEVVSTAEARTTKRQASREVTQATKYLAEAAERRIDLRGEYGDDAVIKVDRFLADASAHGLDRVEIIHGHGTGALSRRITQHLKAHNLVQTYRYGEPHEGGSGVTIVELK